MKKSFRILSLCVALMVVFSISGFAKTEINAKSTAKYAKPIHLSYIKSTMKTCNMVGNPCADAIALANAKFNAAVVACSKAPSINSPQCVSARTDAENAEDSAIIVCALGSEGDIPAPIDPNVCLFFSSKSKYKNKG